MTNPVYINGIATSLRL